MDRLVYLILAQFITSTLSSPDENATNGLSHNSCSNCFGNTLDNVNNKRLKVREWCVDYNARNATKQLEEDYKDYSEVESFKKIKNKNLQNSKTFCCFIFYLKKFKNQIPIVWQLHDDNNCITSPKKSIRRNFHRRKIKRTNSKNHTESSNYTGMELLFFASKKSNQKKKKLNLLNFMRHAPFINKVNGIRRSRSGLKNLITNHLIMHQNYLHLFNHLFKKHCKENKTKKFIFKRFLMSLNFKNPPKNLLSHRKWSDEFFKVYIDKHVVSTKLRFTCTQTGKKDQHVVSNNESTYSNFINLTQLESIIKMASKELIICTHQLKDICVACCLITATNTRNRNIKIINHAVLLLSMPHREFSHEVFANINLIFERIIELNLTKFKSFSPIFYFLKSIVPLENKNKTNTYVYIIDNYTCGTIYSVLMGLVEKFPKQNIHQCKFNKAEKHVVMSRDLKMADGISEPVKASINKKMNLLRYLKEFSIDMSNSFNALRSNTKRVQRDVSLRNNSFVSKAQEGKNMAIKQGITSSVTNDNIRGQKNAKNNVYDGSQKMDSHLKHKNISTLEEKINNDTYGEKKNYLENQKNDVGEENEEYDYKDDEQYRATGAENSKVIMIVTYSTAFVLGCVGNLLFIKVLFFILKNRHKISKGSQSSMLACSRYLLNLSVSDLLLVSTLPIVCYVIHETNWPFYSLGCKFFYGARETNKLVSVYTLVALSFDRYVASFREAARYRTPKVGAIVCVTLWIVSIALTFPYWFYADEVVLTKTDSKDQCLVEQPSLAFETHFEPYLKSCFPDNSNFYHEQFFSFTNEIRGFPSSLVSQPQPTNKTSDVEQVTCRMFQSLIQKLHTVKNITKIIKTRPREHKSISHCRWLMSDYSLFIITSIHFTLGFCVPFVLIVFIYIALAIRLRHVLKTPTFKRSVANEPTMSMEGFNTTAANFRGLRKRPSVAMTRIALVVSLAFLFTQLPYYIMELVHAQQSVSHSKPREEAANSVLIYRSVKDTVCQRVFLKHYLNLKVKTNIVVVRCIFESYLRELKFNNVSESCHENVQQNDLNAFKVHKKHAKRYFDGTVNHLQDDNYSGRNIIDGDAMSHSSVHVNIINKKSEKKNSAKKYTWKSNEEVSKKYSHNNAAVKIFKKPKIFRKHRSKRINLQNSQQNILHKSLKSSSSSSSSSLSPLSSLSPSSPSPSFSSPSSSSSSSSSQQPSEDHTSLQNNPQICINHKSPFKKEHKKNKKINDRSIEKMCSKDPIGTMMPKKDFKLLVVFSALAKVFEYFSCTFNPIIYGFMNKNFRQLYGVTLFGNCCKK